MLIIMEKGIIIKKLLRHSTGKVKIKGKVEQSKEWGIALPYISV